VRETSTRSWAITRYGLGKTQPHIGSSPPTGGAWIGWDNTQLSYTSHHRNFVASEDRQAADVDVHVGKRRRDRLSRILGTGFFSEIESAGTDPATRRSTCPSSRSAPAGIRLRSHSGARAAINVVAAPVAKNAKTIGRSRPSSFPILPNTSGSAPTVILRDIEKGTGGRSSMPIPRPKTFQQNRQPKARSRPIFDWSW